MAVRIKNTAVSGNSNEPLDHTAYSRSLAKQIARHVTPAATAVGIFAGCAAHAATITVNSTADNDPPNEGDGDCTLREAINAMNNAAATADCPNTGAAFGTDDEILFNSTLSGSTITLNGTQLPTITQALKITGPVAGDASGLSLDAAGKSRIFDIQGTTASDFEVELASLTLTGGYTSDFEYEHGGAIRADQADIRCINTLITGNVTTYEDSYGGGLSVIRGNAVIMSSTISNNSTKGYGSPGGGIYVAHNADITDSVISGNTTEGENSYGGGIVTDRNITLTNSTVENNKTLGTDGYGGGVYTDGDAYIYDSVISNNATYGRFSTGGGFHLDSGDAIIHNTTISGNVTMGDDAEGGGLWADGDVILRNSHISGNKTMGKEAYGGGVKFIGNNSNYLRLYNSTISNNSTEGLYADGGGIQGRSGKILAIDSTITGNKTTNDEAAGGGIYSKFSPVDIINSTIANNVTMGNLSPGGGIAVFREDVHLTNSTVSGNSTLGTNDSQGAGLFVQPDDQTPPKGNVYLTHATFADNSAEVGSSLSVISSTNTIVINNTIITPAPGTTPCSGYYDSGDNNLFTGTTCNGTSTARADINIAPLNFNGGPTQTHALNTGSVAIDAADTTICGNLMPQVDQRGVLRPIGAACDIGAYEAGAQFDMGDAPDAVDDPNTAEDESIYPTLLANNGAAHVPGGPALNTAPDTEADGQPSDLADGDDTTDTADEDGVVFTSTLEAGTEATILVTVTSGPALLNAWMDFNADGDWNDEGEQIFTDESLADGNNPDLPIQIPDDVTSGRSFARFRLDTDGGLTPRGVANSGEVEDRVISFTRTLTIGDISQAEGTDTSTTFSLPISFTGPTPEEISVDFEVQDDTATVADDGITPASGTVVIPAGATDGQIDIEVDADSKNEADESFTVALTSATNASLPVSPAMVTILNDDDVPEVMFNDAVSDPVIRENAGTRTIEDAVVLSSPSGQEITVQISLDGGGSTADIPADFDFSPKTVTFAPGETSANLEITVVDDGVEEDPETALFNLASPTNAVLGMPDTFSATLEDPPPPSSDDGDDDDCSAAEAVFLFCLASGCSMGDGNGRIDPTLILLALVSLWAARIRKSRRRAQVD